MLERELRACNSFEMNRLYDEAEIPAFGVREVIEPSLPGSVWRVPESFFQQAGALIEQ
jgi:hypothetical protein